MKLYLDACCFNRPFDDQRQTRVHLESEAVLAILGRVVGQEWKCLGSEMLEFEIGQTADPDRRKRVLTLIAAVAKAGQNILIDENVRRRGNELQTAGFRSHDALHIASAERGGADVMLTTDDRLVRLARRESSAGRLKLKVENPLAWLTEQLAMEEGIPNDA